MVHDALGPGLSPFARAVPWPETATLTSPQPRCEWPHPEFPPQSCVPLLRVCRARHMVQDSTSRCPAVVCVLVTLPGRLWALEGKLRGALTGPQGPAPQRSDSAAANLSQAGGPGARAP